MAKIKPFKGVRPPKQFVKDIICRPYDVLDSIEAKIEAGNNCKSLYHIIKPEINFSLGIEEYDSKIYKSASEQFELFQQNKWLKQDDKEYYYLYAQTMNNKTQYGLVLCCHIDEYKKGNIKKHEFTRKDKEEDRINHIRTTGAHIEPVFLAYKERLRLNLIIKKYSSKVPEYDIVTPDDNFRHQFWIIDDSVDINIITDEFSFIETLYIADGHHRSAAAVRVGEEKRKENREHTGEEEYNYYMTVCFPTNQLTILEYNRLIIDLNNLSRDEFLHKLSEKFIIENKGRQNYSPKKLHEFSIYLDSNWYSLTLRESTYKFKTLIKTLDVEISSHLILDEILGIKDLRSSNRIEFVGGIRGLQELKRKVDSGAYKLALVMYPMSMNDIIDISDQGLIMPPKATWFEPKLRSGFVIHKFQ